MKCSTALMPPREARLVRAVERMDQELFAAAAAGQQDALADEEADSASLPERDAEIAVAGDAYLTVGRRADK
ncbi:hypothetical protein [Nocardia sp. NPDC050412]|uniref:hypothetical protein n=1 Tax=Nocardia sp. NPDC050412 TaxID=3364320 RepID=UPI0037AA2CE9